MVHDLLAHLAGRVIAMHEEKQERVEATDRLIDLTVYRLYGLTADQTAVVEGK